MIRRVCALVAALLPGCGDSESCTEIDCDDEAVVTYPTGLVEGAYELTLSNGGTTETFFCNDPERTPENPPGISCDQNGFTLDGSDFAARSSVTVTIVDENEDVVVERSEVTLQAIETLQPNGPGCDPTCVIRNGRLLP